MAAQDPMRKGKIRRMTRAWGWGGSAPLPKLCSGRGQSLLAPWVLRDGGPIWCLDPQPLEPGLPLLGPRSSNNGSMGQLHPISTGQSSWGTTATLQINLTPPMARLTLLLQFSLTTPWTHFMINALGRKGSWAARAWLPSDPVSISVHPLFPFSDRDGEPPLGSWPFPYLCGL